MNERDMSLLKAVSEAVKEQLSAVQKRYETALMQQAEKINRLKSQIEEYQQSVPDEQVIADLVLAKIEVPAAPVLPDIELMVKNAVGEIEVPEAPALPDIEGMVRDAMSAIELPQPEKLPDIKQMVKDAVTEIPLPSAPVLPDIEGMVQNAVSAIELPQPEPLPDIAQMVKNAVAEIPIPEAPESPEIPDISAMVRNAVADIDLPQPKKLPDIKQMIEEAISTLPKVKNGEPGEDGKDALQIEIMPHIDTEKSHPRGTYAIHHGGLWRSFQKTTGMNGWECLVDGISDIDITQAGERNFTVTAIKSSGEKTEKTFSMPVMIYRDIFKEGEKYYPGDSVTWGGSVWYCHQETVDKPGEDNSKGWKLAVKRGRDARAK